MCKLADEQMSSKLEAGSSKGVLIDTHTHVYLGQFDADRRAVIERAVAAGVRKQFMPNIDSKTVSSMLDVARAFPGICLPMMALHPTSVKENYKEELRIIEQWFEKESFVAVGETGIDLYWDKTFEKEQKDALSQHIYWAVQHDLPLVLHSRNSMQELFDVLEAHKHLSFTGVFHCFPGDEQQAKKAVGMGFMLGVGGVVTYNKSIMAKVAKAIGLEHIILETDAPYLAPVPHRGKRNESAYLVHVAGHIATIKDMTNEEVAAITTENAIRMFRC